MASSALSPVVKSSLPLLTEDELADITTEERRAEVFMLHSTGWTQAKIARYFGVVQATISNDLKLERAKRRSRLENIDDEIERVVGVVENVMNKAWTRHNEAAESNINSVAATNYLKIVLEAADRYASLRGFDLVKAASNTPSGKTRVIVQIGGSGDQPAIQVGVEA